VPLPRSFFRISGVVIVTETGSASALTRSGSSTGVFVIPLRRTAGYRGGCDGHRLIGQQRVDGVAGILRFHLIGAFVIVDAALIAELAALIEDEDLGRRGRAEFPGEGLRIARRTGMGIRCGGRWRGPACR